MKGQESTLAKRDKYKEIENRPNIPTKPHQDLQDYYVTSTVFIPKEIVIEHGNKYSKNTESSEEINVLEFLANLNQRQNRPLNLIHHPEDVSFTGDSSERDNLNPPITPKITWRNNILRDRSSSNQEHPKELLKFVEKKKRLPSNQKNTSKGDVENNLVSEGAIVLKRRNPTDQVEIFAKVDKSNRFTAKFSAGVVNSKDCDGSLSEISITSPSNYYLKNKELTFYD